MANPILPRAQSNIADRRGVTTKEWYDFFLSLLQFVGEESEQGAIIQSILDRLQALEDADDTDAIIQGSGSVNVLGMLSNGFVQIRLIADVTQPGNTYYYGTDAAGIKGWHQASDTLVQGAGIVLTVGADGRTTVDHADTSSVTDHATSNTDGTFIRNVSYTFDQFGHVTGVTDESAQVPHNATAGLQGAGPEYIHLTQGEYDALNNQTLTAVWQYDTSTVMADPGSGDVRSNNTPATSTALAFSTTTNGGLDAGSVLASLQNGDLITIQHAADRSDRARYSVTGNAIDNTTWVEVPVAFIDGDGTVSKNNDLVVRFGIGSGGGSVITQTITDGDTTHAPSGDAVFDALAGKANDTDVVHLTGAESIGGNKTFTGTPSFDSGTAIMSAPAGSNRSFRFQTSGVDRWVFGASGAAETGSNAGSEFFINSYSDAGALLATPLTLLRASATFRWRGSFQFSPDNTHDVGAAGFRVREVFAGNATINTSDAREKTAPRDLTDAELACASDLARLPSIFQWLHAIEAKGEAARLHCSPTVQSVMAVMEAHGLDPFRYGFVCYDEWDEQPEIRDEETGEVTQEYRPAGNRYSLRPSELQAFVSAGMAQRVSDLEARIAALGG